MTVMLTADHWPTTRLRGGYARHRRDCDVPHRISHHVNTVKPATTVFPIPCNRLRDACFCRNARSKFSRKKGVFSNGQ